MLHEAYYPSEISGHYPHKVFYAFVQDGFEENYRLTLVVFYPKLKGTSLFNLSDTTRDDFVNFLLNKHVFRVDTDTIRIAFITPKNDSNTLFYGEQWTIDILAEMVEMEISKQSFLNKLLKYPKEFIFNTHELVTGATQRIRLINHKHLDHESALALLTKIKAEHDLGDFTEFFKG